MCNAANIEFGRGRSAWLSRALCARYGIWQCITEESTAISQNIQHTTYNIQYKPCIITIYVRCTFAKFVNIPCAVSGLKYAIDEASLIAPTDVWNIRLKSRGRVKWPASPVAGEGICSGYIDVSRVDVRCQCIGMSCAMLVILKGMIEEDQGFLVHH